MGIGSRVNDSLDRPLPSNAVSDLIVWDQNTDSNWRISWLFACRKAPGHKALSFAFGIAGFGKF